MTRFGTMRALLSAASLAIGTWAMPAASTSLGTTEHSLYAMVWLHDGAAHATPERPALLTMPPGWATGDAMVVLAPGGDWPHGVRHRLVAAFLDAGAAVLEVNVIRADRERHAALRLDMAAALRTSRDAFGAGLVVALGYGAGGEAALDVAAEAVGMAGERYAGAARLGPGAPAFDLADVPDLYTFEERPGMLCEILAVAQRAGEAAITSGCRQATARR